MATAAAEAELKQQGAFEAAADPNSNVTAADAQAKAELESKKAGVQAFSFNPDASPEEKAAQARSVSSILQINLTYALLIFRITKACARGFPS
jgi:hypothetical protein